MDKNKALTNLQNLLKAAQRERQLIERMVYKNASQHRAARHLQGLRMVARDLRRLDQTVAAGSAQADTAWTLVLVICATIERASAYVLELMSGGWFMPYCIVTFSALARLHALLRTGAETIRDRMVDAGASSEFPSFIGSLHWKDMARSSRTVAAAASVVAQRAAAQAPAVPAPAKEQGDVVEAAVPKPAAKAKPGLADADDLGVPLARPAPAGKRKRP